MQGEFISVWPETWTWIWEPLSAHEESPSDLFCELFRELARAMKEEPGVEALADIVDDSAISTEAFQRTPCEAFKGERALLAFLESAHDVLDDLGGDPLSNSYFNLLEIFIQKFSLRYDLRRPCTLCPTLPGVFASLVNQLRELTSQDEHLHNLMRAYDNSIRDLRIDCSDERIKTCIQRQVNLLEALGQTHPDVTGSDLGQICGQITTWPHKAVRASLSSLYGFASDYPGIRHGGSRGGSLRSMEMRDLVVVSILLAGFTPYLTTQIDADAVYQGR
ncbi:hypothetical protein [Geothrix paludis]|uniref:hypothetical protein n=1 Tax=Geothrix paludis TaxID=2922722 RepID=UPI001FAD041A|nr:hypothetical protein [Geothrix paludis]